MGLEGNGKPVVADPETAKQSTDHLLRRLTLMPTQDSGPAPACQGAVDLIERGYVSNRVVNSSHDFLTLMKK